MMTAQNCGYLTDARLDLSVMLEEENNPPPVAFSSFHELSRWAKSIGNMKIDKLDSWRAVRVNGWVKSSGGGRWWYDQVWVDKNYSSYRSAMMKHVFLRYKITRPTMKDIDADHLVARSILQPWPKAWVCLFPVPKYSNRPFGGIERKLRKVSVRQRMIRLSPIMAFKAFCGFYPRNILERNIVVRDLNGQIMSSAGNKVEELLRLSESEMIPYFYKLK